jgi:hypothetical protein
MAALQHKVMLAQQAFQQRSRFDAHHSGGGGGGSSSGGGGGNGIFFGGLSPRYSGGGGGSRDREGSDSPFAGGGGGGSGRRGTVRFPSEGRGLPLVRAEAACVPSDPSKIYKVNLTDWPYKRLEVKSGAILELIYNEAGSSAVMLLRPRIAMCGCACCFSLRHLCSCTAFVTRALAERER